MIFLDEIAGPVGYKTASQYLLPELTHDILAILNRPRL